ncbi:MAG TPA: Rieske 2Fe-2S domain-containing protein [Acidimicrobiales bacterium]|nr:Rieske 2Fe-2S domain-containing protein [Acidimicrobiales bacterium]
MNRYPFPLPYGWFQVCEPEEVAAGATKALYYFDRHLVAWRDDGGELHVMDAFCPHLGAHLGHGGTVEGCQIQCPFHGWRFDTEGTNVDIPYSTRTNKRARVRAYPTCEVNGKSLAWFHPDPEVEPQWHVPALPELADGEGWWGPVRTRHTVQAHTQELGENAVDSAHFRYVHNTAEVPEITSYVTDGPLAEMKSVQRFPTPRGVVDGFIESTGYGPGVAVVRFGGIVDTLLVTSTTPIDTGSCETRFDFYTRSLGDAEATSNVAQAFVAEVDRQFLEDMPVWEHKAHLTRPALADTDGPFMAFRKWYAQFYAEGTEPGDERSLFPPPYWPDKMDESPAKATASARHGGG